MINIHISLAHAKISAPYAKPFFLNNYSKVSVHQRSIVKESIFKQCSNGLKFNQCIHTYHINLHMPSFTSNPLSHLSQQFKLVSGQILMVCEETIFKLCPTILKFLQHMHLPTTFPYDKLPASITQQFYLVTSQSFLSRNYFGHDFFRSDPDPIQNQWP